MQLIDKNQTQILQTIRLKRLSIRYYNNHSCSRKKENIHVKRLTIVINIIIPIELQGYPIRMYAYA